SEGRMRSLMGSSFAAALLASLALAAPAAAQDHALAGKVASQREGAMEGVLVSARKDGATITVTVASNANGEYRFPAARLEPGAYTFAIRAAGYALARPANMEIAAGKTTVADLALVPAEPRPEEITNAEWLLSAPGPDEMKRLMLNCTDCHGLQRILQSRHTAA